MPRKTFKLSSELTDAKCVGTYNEELEEWSVALFVNGRRIRPATYFTPDEPDARATARAMLARHEPRTLGIAQ